MLAVIKVPDGIRPHYRLMAVELVDGELTMEEALRLQRVIGRRHTIERMSPLPYSFQKPLDRQPLEVIEEVENAVITHGPEKVLAWVLRRGAVDVELGISTHDLGVFTGVDDFVRARMGRDPEVFEPGQLQVWLQEQIDGDALEVIPLEGGRFWFLGR